MIRLFVFILVGFFSVGSLFANEHEEHGDHDEQEEGFELSPQAEKNFEVQRVQGLVILKSAIVKVGDEVNLYRYRDGHYKRIDFQITKTEGNKIHVKSEDLESGDEIVVQGMGFIRVAEIAASGGAVTGHSH